MNIRHQNSAFSIDIDGHHSHLDYALADDVMTITHTRVPEALAGRGIAGALTKAAFDHARAQGWKIVPACSYAAAWAQRHLDAQDVLL